MSSLKGSPPSADSTKASVIIKTANVTKADDTPKSSTSGIVVSPTNKKEEELSEGLFASIRKHLQLDSKPEVKQEPVETLKNEHTVRIHYEDTKGDDNIKVNDKKEQLRYTLYYTKGKQCTPYTKVIKFNSLTLNAKSRTRSFNNDNNHCFLVKLPTNIFYDNTGASSEILTLKSSDPKNEAGGFNRLMLNFPDMFINLPNSTSKPFKGSGENDINVRREMYIQGFHVGPFKFNKTTVLIKYGTVKVSTFTTNAGNVLFTVIYPSFVIEYKKGKQVRMPAFKIGPITFPRETNKDGLTASALESDPVGICIPDVRLPSDENLESCDKENTPRYKFEPVDYGPVILTGKVGDNIIRARIVKMCQGYTLLHPLNSKNAHIGDFSLDVPTELCKFTFKAVGTNPVPITSIVPEKNEYLAPNTVREIYSLEISDSEGKTEESTIPVIEGINMAIIHDTSIGINFVRTIETLKGSNKPEVITGQTLNQTQISSPSQKTS